MLENKSISTSEELSAYLMDFGIPVSNWGKGNAKEVCHLLSEINNGDCELVEKGGELIRRIHAVNISVFAEFDGKIHELLEDRQVFNEGGYEERTRKRGKLNGAVKEKIHTTENPDDAAIRAIHEELGLNSEISLKKTSCANLFQKSHSFPGLNTQYVLNYYEVILTGGQIQKDGYKEVQPDKTTYFVWTV